MKYLVFILFFFSLGAHGQDVRGQFKGVFEMDCNDFLLENLVRQEGIMGTMAGKLLKKGVKTLYVQKTAYLDKHADTIMNGYNIRFIDPEKDGPRIYRELKDSTAALVYMGSPLSRHAYHEIILMPLYMVKKRGKTKAQYTGNGCTYTFFFNFGDSRFSYDKTACF